MKYLFSTTKLRTSSKLEAFYTFNHLNNPVFADIFQKYKEHQQELFHHHNLHLRKYLRSLFHRMLDKFPCMLQKRIKHLVV